MRLPPMNTLRAFEAAARHGSFKRASEELCVTPGAISRFVKVLEDDLGVRLFERLPNGLRLTPKGYELSKQFEAALRLVENAVADIKKPENEIRLVLPTTLALRLLIRKITEWNEAGRRPRLRYFVEFQDWDEFFKSDCDFGICCASGLEHRPSGLDIMQFRTECLTPLCSPNLLEGDAPLKRLSDLKRFDLLHGSPGKEDWRLWLSEFPVEGLDPESGQTFMSVEHAVNVASRGLGVVLADRTLFETEIQEGELVVPFDKAITSNTGYYLFGHPDRMGRPDIEKVCAWLVAEAGNVPTPMRAKRSG